MDASPTKAWMILHRTEENVQELFRLGFDKRPKEELYDLRVDPHHMNNVAGNIAYSNTQKRLAAKLIQILRQNNDPRVVEAKCLFDHEPFAGPLPKA